MKNYKKEIIGGIIILFLMVAGFTSVSTSAFRWIGKVKLLDTLDGNLRLNNDINVAGGDLNLEGASTNLTMGTTANDIQLGYSTITKDLTLNSNQSSGNLMIFDFPNNSSGAYKFKVAGNEKFSIDNTYTVAFNQFHISSPAGLVMSSLPTDSLRIADVSKDGTVSNALGYILVYVGGEARYIQLYDTP